MIHVFFSFQVKSHLCATGRRVLESLLDLTSLPDIVEPTLGRRNLNVRCATGAS